VVLLVFGDFVQRRLRDEHVSVFYQRAHIAEEEGQKQNSDVAAVHVRVGHTYDALVSQFAFVEFVAYAAAESRNHGFYFLVFQNASETRLFHIENFSP